MHYGHRKANDEIWYKLRCDRQSNAERIDVTRWHLQPVKDNKTNPLRKESLFGFVIIAMAELMLAKVEDCKSTEKMTYEAFEWKTLTKHKVA